MAAVQRLLQTSTRAALPSFAFSRIISNGLCRPLASVRYNGTSANATPAPDNSTSGIPQNEPIPLPDVKGRDGATDWSRSYSGLSVQPFAKEVSETLQAPVLLLDIEIKPGEC